MSLALTSRRAALMPGQWVRNELWRRARAVPSLDLRFADNKSLVDATTGASLVTFTRASSATYVDSQGVIQSAVTNLLLRSEEFDNASWTKQSSVSVSVNTTAAPNGSLTADTITADSALGIYQNITSTVGLTYANSIYVKAGTATSMLLRDDNGAGRHIQFNPSTGVITATSGTLLSSASTAVGDGWFRYSMVYVADSTAVRGILRPSSSGSAQTFILWGAQVEEQSSTVGEYIPTTSTVNSAPRFDHNPTTGESLGLLVEEQRTNLLLRSEEFETWTNNNLSITANNDTAPNGTATADLWTNTSTTGTLSQSITKAATATTYTASVWVKSTQATSFSLTIDDGATVNRGRAVFNITTGALTSTTNDGDFTNTSATITAHPNSWYRITVTTTTNTQTTARLRAFFGGNTNTLLIWGAQLEAGAFPTSYIPTTTATVTRSADVASITGTAFSSWYRQDQGTMFANYVRNGLAATVSPFDINDGTTANFIRFISGASNPANQRFDVAGQATLLLTTTGIAGTNYKAAGSYRLDDIAAVENAGTILTDISATIPVVNQALIGGSANATRLNGTIRRIVFWPQRLPDSSLQTITQ